MQSLGHLDPQQLGGHRLLGVLGRGGQGTVYLAEGPVAIKVLNDTVAPDEAAHRRFLREADAARRVAPFSTAKVLQVGIEGARPFLVSEYIPGPSLDALVKGEGPRSGSGLVRLAVATLTALAAIHRAGIVHRDFKPANVIMGPEGPVVIDFGIARALDHTTTHGVFGTPAFMAPEQFEGVQLTPAADVFSWAITMVFAASGRPAFAGESMPALMHAIMTRDPDLSGVPEDLRMMLAACLAKAPGERPSATDLVGRLTGDTRPPAAATGEPDPASALGDPAPGATRRYGDERHPGPGDSGPHPGPHPIAPQQGQAGSGPWARQQGGPGRSPDTQRPPTQADRAREVAAGLAAGLVALFCVAHALMTWRGAITDDFTAILDWNGWEAVRLGALAMAAPVLTAGLWRTSKVAALFALTLILPFVVDLVYTYALEAPNRLPWLLVGLAGNLGQGVCLVVLGSLTWRLTRVGAVAAILAGAGFVLETILWALVASINAHDIVQTGLHVVSGLIRTLTAVWLVALGVALVARRPRAQAASRQAESGPGHL
ncbi:protein kinase [Nonomuraea sp. B19D2]|uniref:serine/threonine-protein kinase n=1 Tax=Nonomuraea sp. B19D2 TaxID=3159561 RepID=UPI0032DAC851